MIILLIMGALFALSGFLVIWAAIFTHEAAVIPVCCLAGGIFIVIGLIFILIPLMDIHKKRMILKKGEKIWGTIVDYADDTSLYVNGVPGLDIIVRCCYAGENKVCRFKTNQTKANKYPIGASILLAVYQGGVFFFKNSVGGSGAAL